MNLSGTLHLGLIYGLLALGVYVAFRIMRTPDLTADGSFTLGLCVSAMGTLAGHPVLALAAGMAAGALAGGVTGLLHTKCGIHPILAGILTMTGLYSVNVAVMRESPNVSLIGKATVFALTQRAAPFLDRQGARLLLAFLILALVFVLLALFFGTALGLRIRATGDNEKMTRSSSINADCMRVGALALANALTGLCGAVLAQYQGYADINAGTGIVIAGLASVIIGEAFVRRGGLARGLFAACAGAVVYRFLIAAALFYNVFPAYSFRLLSALLVVLALCLQKLKPPRPGALLGVLRRAGARA